MIAPAYLIIANLQIMSSTLAPKLAHCSLSVYLINDCRRYPGECSACLQLRLSQIVNRQSYTLWQGYLWRPVQ